jgi:four helix bundle protein
MSHVGAELLSRVEGAVDRAIRMARALPHDVAGREIGRQVVRSSGSVGANLEEAQATLTRKDFINKVGLALRESRETLYWIRRIESNELLPSARLKELTNEWNELVAILTSIVKRLRSTSTEKEDN